MDLWRRYGLRRVINAYDRATSLSGARVPPEIIEVVAASLGQCFELDAIQEAAGRAIARATGAEWGCVTACSAAGITLGVAASMTGADAGKVAQLPDTKGMPCRVVIQRGHCINFGAPVTQMIRLSGAEVVEAGEADRCTPEQVRHALCGEGIAALVAVESYHTVGYDGVGPAALAALAREAGVPLILDAATQELRLPELVACGPDLVVASGHKYFDSMTAGIVAGRRDLVEAVYLQNRGIGRGMKAGKEAIFGVIASLERFTRRDLPAWTAAQDRKVARVLDLLAGADGLEASSSPDPNGCPFSRVRLAPDAQATGHTAASLRESLAEGDPAVVVRVYGAEKDAVYLNLTDMNDEEIACACEKIRRLCAHDSHPRT